MAIPEGYEKMAVVGIAWKEEYNAAETYKTMNAVYYNGSTYVALRDNPAGPPSSDNINWMYMAKGFEQQLLSALTALDTSGIVGEAGAEIGAQVLIDALADRVMTKLIAKSAIVQTESESMETVPSSAYIKQQFDIQNSNLGFFFDGTNYADLDSAVQACIDSLPNNNETSYMGTIRRNGQYRAIVQKYTNINYASAILISYDLSTARYFRKAAGEWKVTVNFITDSDITNLFTVYGSAVENCNDLISPGIYPKAIHAKATNGPGHHAYLLNLHYIDANNNNITQVAFGYNTGTISIRNRLNGTWSAWTEK